MREIIYRIKMEDNITVEQNRLKVKKALIRKDIEFKGILMELKTRVSYIWR